LTCKSFVNPPSLSFKIRIERANDDAGMIWIMPMQLPEIFPVQRQHCSAFKCCEGQHLFIRNGLSRLSRV
jgi:hypothetical protein